jgi:hypothetical protein
MTIELATALVIGAIFFAEWLRHNATRNSFIELKSMFSMSAEEIKEHNLGLRDSTKSIVNRAKPKLPEDLDELTEIFLKMAKKGWVISYNWDLAVHFYQIAQLAAVNGWKAEWAEENGICYIRLIKNKGR